MSQGTLPMYEVPEHTKGLISELGLDKNIQEMQEKGYTILTDAAPQAFNQELRNAILRKDGFRKVELQHA